MTGSTGKIVDKGATSCRLLTRSTACSADHLSVAAFATTPDARSVSSILNLLLDALIDLLQRHTKFKSNVSITCRLGLLGLWLPVAKE